MFFRTLCDNKGILSERGNNDMTMQEKADAFDKILQKIYEKREELTDLMLKDFATVEDLDKALSKEQENG